MAKHKKSFKDPVLQFISSGEDGAGASEAGAVNAPGTSGEDGKEVEQAATESAKAETQPSQEKAAKPAQGRKAKSPSLQAVPEGYRVDHRYVEIKSRRVQLVFQQTLYDRVKALADRKNLSFNECVHQLLDLAMKHVKE